MDIILAGYLHVCAFLFLLFILIYGMFLISCASRCHHIFGFPHFIPNSYFVVLSCSLRSMPFLNPTYRQAGSYEELAEPFRRSKS